MPMNSSLFCSSALSCEMSCVINTKNLMLLEELSEQGVKGAVRNLRVQSNRGDFKLVRITIQGKDIESYSLSCESGCYSTGCDTCDNCVICDCYGCYS